MDITKPSDWISVRFYGDAIITSDGRATEEEMRGFYKGVK